MKIFNNGFNNKVAAITGAGSGIGRQLAVALAKKGCHVAISDIDENSLQETKQSLQKYAVDVSTYTLDVADRAAMKAWADFVVQEHGKVNMIFNNAGVAIASTVEGGSYEDFEWLMSINFWGVVYGTKEFLPHLKASKEGYVINISSIMGLASAPTLSAYNASKFAVKGFTESLAQELTMLDNGVNALTVHPGGVSTNMVNYARIRDNIRALGLSSNKAKKQANIALVLPPQHAAEAILKAVLANKQRVIVGADAFVVDKAQRVMPTAYYKPLLKAVGKGLRFIKKK